MKKHSMKFVALLLVASLVAMLLAACGGNNNAPAGGTTSSTPPSSSTSSETSSGDASGGEVLELKLGHNVAASGITGEQYHAFAEAVAKESGGTIKVTEYTAGSLITDTQALDAMMDGTCDFAHGMVSYLDGVIKDLVPLEVPGYYSGDDFMAFSDGVQEILEDIFADYGVKFLGCNYQGQAAFVSPTKQILSPADLQGMSVRASGTYIGKAVQNWGGAPTTISLPDLTTALERKTVDAAYTGWTVVGSFKLYEMAPYVTITSITESFGCLMMSMKTWDSLTPDQQAAIERAAESWRQETYDIGLEFRQQYIDEMTAGGATVVELSAEETQPFTDLSTSLYDEIEGTLGEKGQTLLDTLKELNG